MEELLVTRVKTGVKLSRRQQVVLDAGTSIHITPLPEKTKGVTAQSSTVAFSVLISEHSQSSIIN